MRILVVDNHDSFVFNLVHYLGQLGADCEVRRNDEIDAAAVERLGVRGILLSPGPGRPEQAGACLDLIARYGQRLPILGVCLGHQAIGAAFGATVTRAPEPRHGVTSAVRHDGQGVLAGLPDPFLATRYHSLVIDGATLPASLAATGWTDDGVVMAVRHRELPIEGVQFHPESVLSQSGHLLLANWLAGCGLPRARERAPGLAAEVDVRRAAAFAAG